MSLQETVALPSSHDLPGNSWRHRGSSILCVRKFLCNSIRLEWECAHAVPMLPLEIITHFFHKCRPPGLGGPGGVFTWTYAVYELETQKVEVTNGL
jgi:hypothetical protein